MIMLGIVVIAATLATILKNKIENLLAFSIIVVTSITYLFAVTGIIKAGLWISVALVIISGCYLIYSFITRKKEILEYVFTPGIVAFFLMSLAFALFCRGVDASLSPDSFYWVRIAKGILYYDDYWKALYAQTHPQFIAMWAYLAMKTWKGWSESLLVASNNVFLISILMPLFSCVKCGEKEDKTGIGKNVLLSIAIFFIPYISDSSEYGIYASDMIMGLLIGMGMVLFSRALKEGKNIYFFISLSYFVAATGTKRIAIAVAAIFFVWIFYLLLQEKNYKIIALYTVTPIVSYLVFRGIDPYSATVIGALFGAIAIMLFGRIKGKIKYVVLVVFGVPTVAGAGNFVLKKAADKYVKVDQPTVIRAFVEMLFTVREDWYYVGSFLKLPVTLFLAGCIICFVAVYLRKKESFLRHEVVLFFGINVSIVVYLLLLFYLYITQISSASGALFQDSLLGLSRYMKIIPIFAICYLAYIIVSKFDDYRITAIMALCVLLFADLGSFSQFILVTKARTEFAEFDKAGIELAEDDEIAFINMGEKNYYKTFLLDLYPNEIENVDKLSLTYRGAHDMQYMAVEELSDQIKDCKYLYIFDADQAFAEKYAQLFADRDDIQTNRAIYEVEESGKLLKLIYSE